MTIKRNIELVNKRIKENKVCPKCCSKNWKWLGGEDDECKCKDCGEYFPAMGFYERILSNKGGYDE